MGSRADAVESRAASETFPKSTKEVLGHPVARVVDVAHARSIVPWGAREWGDERFRGSLAARP